MSLEAKQIRFGYRKKGTVLEDISLTVEPGQRPAPGRSRCGA